MQIRIVIDAQIDVDGKTPDNNFVIESAINAINDAMPSVLVDSDERDCILFVREWEITALESA